MLKKVEIPEVPFYFVRHGQTDWNAKRKIMGQTDIELNEIGNNEAYDAAYILGDIEIGKAFSSPLRRAQQTAKIIAEVSEIELELYPEFKERCWGVAEGTDGQSTLSALSDENLPEKAEKYVDFETRIIKGVRQMLLSEVSYPIIVSHAGVFKVLAKILAGIDKISCPNCKIFFFTPPSLSNNWEITEI